MALLHHPDKQRDPASADDATFKQIQEAYDHLQSSAVANFDRLHAARDAQFEAEIKAFEDELQRLEGARKQRESELREARLESEQSRLEAARERGVSKLRTVLLALLNRAWKRWNEQIERRRLDAATSERLVRRVRLRAAMRRIRQASY